MTGLHVYTERQLLFYKKNMSQTARKGIRRFLKFSANSKPESFYTGLAWKKLRYYVKRKKDKKYQKEKNN